MSLPEVSGSSGWGMSCIRKRIRHLFAKGKKLCKKHPALPGRNGILSSSLPEVYAGTENTKGQTS